jgi:hypothetical protein
VSYRDLDAILASIEHSSEQKNGVAHTQRAHHFGARFPHQHLTTAAA